MKKTKLRLILCCTGLAAILAFIWGNSAMPGEASGELSGWVGELLCKLLPFLSLESESGMHILRKIAHFSEFAMLGVFFAWFWGMLTGKPMFRYGLPVLCGVCVAAIDETIQIFSPGRYCSIKDVGIDSCGVLTGVIVLCIAVWLFQKCKKDAQ